MQQTYSTSLLGTDSGCETAIARVLCEDNERQIKRRFTVSVCSIVTPFLQKYIMKVQLYNISSYKTLKIHVQWTAKNAYAF